MELDSLKNTWQNESPESTPEISLEKQKELHLPLEKIRRNMRMEFWSSVFFLAFAFVFIWSLTFMPFKFKFYLTMLTFSMVIVVSFFFYQFFLFYKEISNLTVKTFESLKDLMLQFQLNKQYYISFYLSFVPFLVCELMIVINFIPAYDHFSNLKFAILFLGLVLFSLTLLFFVGKWWFQCFYGKHIKNISQQIEDLK
ncbi:hypothetical protein [Halpernia sp.]|uniref:hypothetical protein n=1 Tax=Halpernia sp. TaxID=2782209 RepID=UPI003A90F9BB